MKLTPSADWELRSFRSCGTLTMLEAAIMAIPTAFEMATLRQVGEVKGSMLRMRWL